MDVTGMKDSAEILSRAVRVATVAAMIATAACGKSNKAADVAQDSILVNDANVPGNKTDTAGAATAALVRERGSSAQLPALTNGAPVARSPNVAPPVQAAGATSRTRRTTTSQPTLQPPEKVYPSPVLPPRESTTATPKKDSSADSLSARPPEG